MIDPTMKSCLLCAEPIRASAKKCVHCDSYQDLRRYLPLSASVLTSLVALLSVATVFVTVVLDRLPKTDAFIDSVVSHFTDDDRLALIVGNSGEKPGSLARGRLFAPLQDGRFLVVPFQLRGADQSLGFLAPGDYRMLLLEAGATQIFPVSAVPDLGRNAYTFEAVYNTFDGDEGYIRTVQKLGAGSDHHEFMTSRATASGVSILPNTGD